MTTVFQYKDEHGVLRTFGAAQTTRNSDVVSFHPSTASEDNDDASTAFSDGGHDTTSGHHTKPLAAGAGYVLCCPVLCCAAWYLFCICAYVSHGFLLLCLTEIAEVGQVLQGPPQHVLLVLDGEVLGSEGLAEVALL